MEGEREEKEETNTIGFSDEVLLAVQDWVILVVDIVDCFTREAGLAGEIRTTLDPLTKQFPLDELRLPHLFYGHVHI